MRKSRRIFTEGGSAQYFTDKTADGTLRRLHLRNICALETSRHSLRIAETEEFGRVMILDDELQLAEVDEDTYHTGLVASVLEASFKTFKTKIDVLLLGGGDGFALRKVLAEPNVRSATLVDHDEDIVQLFSSGELGKPFDTSAGFRDLRTKIVISDANEFLHPSSGIWHAIIIDLTDKWLRNQLHLLTLIGRLKNERGIFVSLNAGSAGVESARSVRNIVHAGLVPIAQFTFGMLSFGEPWTTLLCATKRWSRQATFRSSLPSSQMKWLLESDD